MGQDGSGWVRMGQDDQDDPDRQKVCVCERERQWKASQRD